MFPDEASKGVQWFPIMTKNVKLRPKTFKGVSMCLETSNDFQSFVGRPKTSKSYLIKVHSKAFEGFKRAPTSPREDSIPRASNAFNDVQIPPKAFRLPKTWTIKLRSPVKVKVSWHLFYPSRF